MQFKFELKTNDDFLSIYYWLSKNTEAKVTFWGHRIIKIQDASDYINIHFLAQELLRQKKTLQQLDYQGQMAALKIYEMLMYAYLETDALVKSKNVITKLFFYTRELSKCTIVVIPKLRRDIVFGKEALFLAKKETASKTEHEKKELSQMYEKIFIKSHAASYFFHNALMDS